MSKNAKNDRITLNERDNKATKDQLKNVGEKPVFDEMKAYDDVLRNKQLMELDKSNKKNSYFRPIRFRKVQNRYV